MVWNKSSRDGKSTPITMVLAAAVLIAIVANVWWALRTERSSVATNRKQQVSATGNALVLSAEALLAANELTALRRLLIESARSHDLAECRIELPDGQVVAASDPSFISTQQLPTKWNGQVVESASESQSRHEISGSYPLNVAGRGSARLELTAPIASSGVGSANVAIIISTIGMLALAGYLYISRAERRQLRAAEAVRRALCARAEGETAAAALTVSTEFGNDAGAWNEMVLEIENLRSEMLAEKARDTSGNSHMVNGNLYSACDAMSQGLILVDEKMKTIYSNGAAAVFLGGDRDALVGSDLSKFISEQPVIELISAVTKGSARSRPIVEVERVGDGNTTVLRFSVRRVRRNDPASAMVIIEDVTQQRVAEVARNAFVAQATHELRAPLTNIRLYVETALEQGDEDVRMRENCLNVINQETRRLETLVGDMLSTAEIEAGSRQITPDDVRLKTLFEDLQRDFEALAREKKIKLTFNLPPKLPVIRGDRDMIVLAMHNLVGNALKYTPEGGEVTLTTEVRRDQIHVEVADSGIGINDEDTARIFEKLFRAKDERVTKVTGSGLGLSLAREVIRLHGGDIIVDSELNKGSTFTLTLPHRAEAA